MKFLWNGQFFSINASLPPSGDLTNMSEDSKKISPDLGTSTVIVVLWGLKLIFREQIYLYCWILRMNLFWLKVEECQEFINILTFKTIIKIFQQVPTKLLLNDWIINFIIPTSISANAVLNLLRNCYFSEYL